jgi:tellurite resistance protein
MDEQPNAEAMRRYAFLVMFANDGTIDRSELEFLERLALADHAIDNDEREVLREIFARVEPRTLTPSVREEIARFRQKYAV